MIFHFFVFFIKAYDEEYTNEAYNTLKPDQSPAKLIFNQGLSLMLVEWPDAIINISIPDEFSESVVITKESGLSCFTLKNQATIYITFNSQISYFVTRCPQRNSIEGAIQTISNIRDNLFNERDHAKDIYFSVFGPHIIQGSATHDWMTGTVTFYYMDEEHTELKSDIKNISIPEAFCSSSLVRQLVDGTISYNLSYKSLASYENPTISTYVQLKWSTLVTSHNYLSNEAFGGIGDSSKAVLLRDIKYELTINSATQLGAKFGYNINGQIISPLTETVTITAREPITVDLYVIYNECKEFTKFRTIELTNCFTKKIVNLTDDDIPSECEIIPVYRVCADLSALSDDYEISYILVPGDGRKKVAVNGLNEEKSSSPFDVNATLSKSPNCDDKFLRTIHASTNFKCLNVTVESLPDECTGESESKKKKNKIALIAGCACGAAAVVACVVAIVVIVNRKKKDKDNLLLDSQNINDDNNYTDNQ